MYRKKYTGKYCKKHVRYKGLQRLMYGVNMLLLVAAAIQVFGLAEPAGKKDSVFLSVGATTVEAAEADTKAPEILGVRNIQVYAGETMSYRSGVLVVDDVDESPTLQVNSSLVNLTREGTYPVTYHAEDASGNSSSLCAYVTVLPRKAGFKDMQTIWKSADATLGVLIEKDMTQEEQVRAIYDWCWNSCRYSGHTDRTDYRQAAYTMLTTGTGDCYGFFAVSKLLFERLGIPNIDVVKVKNQDTDSEHFWSLVSVDGGETYYHFDATPRLGQTESFCLVTDQVLDKYSENHEGSHNRDASLYPKTPEA